MQGWKVDGEWPPKSSYAEEGNGKVEGGGGGKAGRGRREGSLRDKMKVLRIVDGDGDGDGTGLGERVARRSVGKVKRALGR